MEEKKRGTARIIFTKADGYRLAPVTGAWGGVSPQKEVVVDFHLDYRTNPEYIDVEMESPDGGRVTKETRTPSEQPIERLIHFGAVMRPDIARSVGEFLIAKANEAFGEAGSE